MAERAGEAVREPSGEEEPTDSFLTDDGPNVGRSYVIDAQGLEKKFGSVVVLSDLLLQVQAGEIFGLIGPSGSGKSTTIHLCCGHLRPDSGTLTVLGECPTRFRSETRRRIGYMPQNFILYPDLSVEQNIAFAAGLYSLPEWRSHDRIREKLELVELWEARKKVARAVSGGMLRRLALAAALVHEPDLLFADEPTANLDPILRTKLWSHFRSLSDQGRTLVITTQYIDEAEYCDRVGLMFDGTLIATGRPRDLRRSAYGGDIVDIVIERPSPDYVRAVSTVAGVESTETPADESLRVTARDAQSAIPVLIERLEASGAKVRSISQYQPTFDEVFIRLIEQRGEPRPSPDVLRRGQAG